MDPKIYFWSASLLLFVALVASAFAGWRAIRRQDIGSHKRWMNTSIVLVLLFVASYVVKVLVLGKEELELWSAGDRGILWTHETFVFIMILAGTAARLLGRKLDPDRRGAREASTTRGRHRLLGRTAVVASVLGALTAAFVLVGMFLRAG